MTRHIAKQSQCKHWTRELGLEIVQLGNRSRCSLQYAGQMTPDHLSDGEADIAEVPVASARQAQSVGIRVSAVVWSLFGAAVSVFPSMLVAFGAWEWSNRMICTDQTGWGGGCYENQLALSIAMFLIAFLPFFLPVLIIAMRGKRRRLTNWLLLGLLCLVPIMTGCLYAAENLM